MVEGLGTIGYTALNLGRTDLLLAPELLRRLAGAAAFPFLSANIVEASGTFPFTPWIVREIDGQLIGIFGLAGNQPQPLAVLPGRDLVVGDPFQAARSAVAELRRSCRLVIALSQLGLDEDARLAREVPGIDLILGGYTRALTSAPRVEGNTLILHAGAKGMRLGALEIELLPGPAGAWTARAAAKGGESRLYAWELVPLDLRLPDNPALVALLERFREEAHKRRLSVQTLQPASAPPPPEKAAYVGVTACGSCHQVQLAQWRGSKHARALAALATRRQELNPDCVKCHVTAYGEPDGYRPGVQDGVDLANVQCEACHGFGREHHGPGRIRRSVPETICRRCHTTENSPTFKYEPYLKMLGPHTARYFTRRPTPAPGR